MKKDKRELHNITNENEQIIVDCYVQAFSAVFFDEDKETKTRDDKRYLLSFSSWNDSVVDVYANLDTLETEEICEDDRMR